MDRRAFLILSVLALLVLISATASWTIARATDSALAAQRRLDGYLWHHEAESLKSVAERWLTRPSTAARIMEIAGLDESAYQAELPGGVQVSLRVRDGQGTILALPDRAEDEEQRGVILESLSVMPAERDDLIRRVGPARVSFNAASDGVLFAASGGEPDVFLALVELRESGIVGDGGAFIRGVGTTSIGMDGARRLLKLFTFRPELWMVEASVRDARGERLYEVMAEAEGNLVRVHRARRVSEFARDRLERDGGRWRPGDGIPGGVDG